MSSRYISTDITIDISWTLHPSSRVKPKRSFGIFSLKIKPLFSFWPTVYLYSCYTTADAYIWHIYHIYMNVSSTYLRMYVNCKLCLLQNSNRNHINSKVKSNFSIFFTFILHFYVMLSDEKRQKSLYMIFQLPPPFSSKKYILYMYILGSFI